MLKQNYVKDVVVVAVHPDDETLGAGGTLLRHKSNGDRIHCIFCTDIYETEGFTKDQILKRDKELVQVCRMYDFDTHYRLGLKTAKVDEYSKSFLVNQFSQIFSKIAPNIVYLPFAYDVHSDHRVIFEAVYSCTKSFRYPSIEKILMMEVVSETEFAPSFPGLSFIPNVFVDITNFIDKKCDIMKIYGSELKSPPFPRSIENLKALALHRGCILGGEQDECIYAESFMLVKERV
ncbi:PIG-L family deacetylase [Campylobacter coli]|uniref:PIG-L deacetylase family protein n=1 Tax=Campylobacter coli TaxID=195 RepID=UPI000257D1AA|nr:PIG-L family deacetylase [Campylobacter coli]EIA70230.1 LmbE-like protein [Campylobacter coli 7--1]EIA89009.1 LmbE-like protein [Campylobacter coli 67-8]APA59237.1 GlcNAc-PI de-N-acetylase [Campylobacter coli]EAC2165033.1 PIG-L family deacetylase [Campylobacter coli]EAH4460119.1 PIG-L family deacetylase [Campylobacter coli]